METEGLEQEPITGTVQASVGLPIANNTASEMAAITSTGEKERDTTTLNNYVPDTNSLLMITDATTDVAKETNQVIKATSCADPILTSSTTLPVDNLQAGIINTQLPNKADIPDTIATTNVTPSKSKRAKRMKGTSTSEVKNICVRFEGNQSKRWDGKEALIDYDWIKEQVDTTELLPGNAISIPWPNKGGDIEYWKGIVVNVDDASTSCKQDSFISGSTKKAKGSKPKQSHGKNSKAKGMQH